MMKDLLESKYVKDFDKAILSRNDIQALQVSLQALKEESENEQLNAVLVSALCIYRIPCYENIKEFLQLFPNSLFPIRVYFAEILCSDGNFDDCVSEARYYLRMVKEYYSGNFADIEEKQTLEMVLKAFLLTTTVYIAAGARSYALRVIELARPYATEVWNKNYDIEKEKLQEELKEPAIKLLDDKWEAFFMDGSHYFELYQLCAEQGFTELVIRLRLLHEAFEGVPGFKVEENELYQIVWVRDSKDYILG